MSILLVMLITQLVAILYNSMFLQRVFDMYIVEKGQLTLWIFPNPLTKIQR